MVKRFFNVGSIFYCCTAVLQLARLSRTYGVSIFIDYCTAPATRRKVEGEERDIQLINMNEASSCLACFEDGLHLGA